MGFFSQDAYAENFLFQATALYLLVIKKNNLYLWLKYFIHKIVSPLLYWTSLNSHLFGKGFLERVFIFLFFVANSEIEVSVSARNVRRLLSFQRYLRSSRFFRGITVPNSSNILDDDYNGQAKVGCLIFIFFKYVL